MHNILYRLERDSACPCVSWVAGIWERDGGTSTCHWLASWCRGFLSNTIQRGETFIRVIKSEGGDKDDVRAYVYTHTFWTAGFWKNRLSRDKVQSSESNISSDHVHINTFKSKIWQCQLVWALGREGTRDMTVATNKHNLQSKTFNSLRSHFVCGNNANLRNYSPLFYLKNI